MLPKEQETAIGELEERVDRLRILYDQYFLGFEKLEPMVPRKDVERRMIILRKEQIRNTAIRWRFNVVTQKYNTYSMYWQRIARQIEEGTYKRHLQKAKKILDGRPAAAERDVSFDIDMTDFDEAPDDVDALLAEADAAVAGLEKGAPDTVPPPNKQLSVETPVSAFRPAAPAGTKGRLIRKRDGEIPESSQPPVSNRDLLSQTAPSIGVQPPPPSNRDLRTQTEPIAFTPPALSSRQMLSRTAPSPGAEPPPPPSNRDLRAQTEPTGAPPSNRDLGTGTAPGTQRRFVAAAAPESAPRIQRQAITGTIPGSTPRIPPPDSAGAPPATGPATTPRVPGHAPRVMPSAAAPGSVPRIQPRASVPDAGEVAPSQRMMPAVPPSKPEHARPQIRPRAPIDAGPETPRVVSQPKIVVPQPPVSQRAIPAAPPVPSQPKIVLPQPPPSQRAIPSGPSSQRIAVPPLPSGGRIPVPSQPRIAVPAPPVSEPGRDSVRPSVFPRKPVPLPSQIKKGDPPKK